MWKHFPPPLTGCILNVAGAAGVIEAGAIESADGCAGGAAALGAGVAPTLITLGQFGPGCVYITALRCYFGPRV